MTQLSTMAQSRQSAPASEITRFIVIPIVYNMIKWMNPFPPLLSFVYNNDLQLFAFAHSLAGLRKKARVAAGEAERSGERRKGGVWGVSPHFRCPLCFEQTSRLVDAPSGGNRGGEGAAGYPSHGLRDPIN